jgi:hypothetical protein
MCGPGKPLRARVDRAECCHASRFNATVAPLVLKYLAFVLKYCSKILPGGTRDSYGANLHGAKLPQNVY